MLDLCIDFVGTVKEMIIHANLISSVFTIDPSHTGRKHMVEKCGQRKEQTLNHKSMKDNKDEYSAEWVEEGAGKVSKGVKCQNQRSQGGKESKGVREKVGVRDVAHALAVIHPLTCGEYQ